MATKPPCAGSDKNGDKNSSGKMAGILLNLQSLLTQLVEALNNLREDILRQPDPNEEDEDIVTPNLLDLTAATNQLFNSSSGQSQKSLFATSRPDKGRPRHY